MAYSLAYRSVPVEAHKIDLEVAIDKALPVDLS
jgi:hypothetical protein